MVPHLSRSGRESAAWSLGFLCLALGTLWLTSQAAEISDSSAFLPPQATVVLLAGLPGDVESENTYRDQLQTWLEIVQGRRQAQSIIVLCDEPASLVLRSPITNHQSQTTVLHADRTNFLSLGPILAGNTNAVVVIAWGHGGKQGTTPVFHVRGPRITPEDFKAVAGQTSAAQSRWILFFRGSGAFASRLAGEKRQVLSSEFDTMFNSDPVGMALLLK